MLKKNVSIVVIIIIAVALIILVIALTNERLKKLEHRKDEPGKAQTELSIIKTR